MTVDGMDFFQLRRLTLLAQELPNFTTDRDAALGSAEIPEWVLYQCKGRVAVQ